MRFLFYLSVIASLCASGSPVAAYEIDPTPLIITKDGMGCQDQALYESIRTNATDNNLKAFRALVAHGMQSGDCRYWTIGTRVIVTELYLDLECLKPVGSTTACYWTIMNSAEPIEEE